MSKGSDWIAAKLAAAAGQQPQAPVRPGYPTQYGPPANPYAQPQQQPVYGQPAPPQGVVTSADLSTPEGVAHLAQQAVAGKQLAQTLWCEECGQNSLFTITKDENGRPLSRPVTRCLNCNWPNLQAGSIHGGATVAKPQGRVHKARQLVDHVVEIQGGAPGRIQGAYAPQGKGSDQDYI